MKAGFTRLLAGVELGAVLLVLAALPAGAAGLPLVWQWSNPLPHGNNIIDVARRDAFWIQVAERGQIYTSDDFLSWTQHSTPTRRALRSVAFLNQRILIVGESGTVLSGASPAELTLLDLGTSDWLEAVASSPQLAVAVGDNGAIYTTPDGQAWQRQDQSFQDWLRSVAYGTPGGHGTFVAVGEGGFIATSPDGLVWQPRPTPTFADLNRVAWVGGEFWAVGDGGVALRSSTGSVWVPVATGAANVLNTFAGLDSLRLAAGDAEVRVSRGGEGWNDEISDFNPLPPPVWTYLSAVAATNSFFLFGRTGMIVEGRRTSDDVLLWAPLYDSPRQWLWDVKRFANLYLAVGDRGSILSSPNGISWQQELPPESATNSILLGVGGRANLAVAVGNGGTIITSPDTRQVVVTTNSWGLFTNEVSTFGIYWEAVLPRPTAEDLQGIAYHDGLFVATGGSGTILTSPDAKSWTRQNSPSRVFLSSVESFPGGVVAVGHSGTILTSPDAVNWTARPTGTTHWIYRVRYLNGKLIAVGQNGTILTSDHGSTWEVQNSGTGQWLNDVQWVGNTYFVVGAQGAVLSSPDTVTWVEQGTITAKSLFAAASHAGMLVTVGIEGIILRSQVAAADAPVQFVRFPTRPGEATFLFSGQAGQKFTLDRSTNLQFWVTGPLLEIEQSGTLLHSDGNSNASPQQFFRTFLK